MSDVWLDTRRLTRFRVAIDVTTAVLFGLLTAVVAQRQGIAAVVATAFVAVALALRRVSLPAMVGLAAVAAVVQVATGEIAIVADLGYAVLFFQLGSDHRSRVRRFGLISAVIAVLGAAVFTWWRQLATQGMGTPTVVSGVALGMSAAVVCEGGWVAGYVRFQNRQAIQAKVDAQLDAAERLRLAQAFDQEQERARIAADMHDVVAHSWAVVAAQADGARYALRTAPDQAERALEVIAETARSAMTDLRTILHELRHSESVGTTMGYEQQSELIERMRASAMKVEVHDVGAPSSSPLIALTSYRMLSEALTNALKHGDLSAPVQVRRDWSDGYRLTVTNTIAPGAPPGAGTGHGIIGMTERATMAGGRLETERVGNTYEVRAHIPTLQKELP